MVQDSRVPGNASYMGACAIDRGCFPESSGEWQAVFWSQQAYGGMLVGILQTKRPSPRVIGHGTMRTRRHGLDERFRS